MQDTDQAMTRRGSRNRTKRNGKTVVLAVYQSQNCEGCPLRGVSHKSTGNRIIEVNHQLKRLKKQARDLLLHIYIPFSVYQSKKSVIAKATLAGAKLSLDILGR
jgi:hypothetical protein